jgi:hypothetical protein
MGYTSGTRQKMLTETLYTVVHESSRAFKLLGKISLSEKLTEQKLDTNYLAQRAASVGD